MLFIAGLVAAALTLLDLDRTFYVPRRGQERARLYAWWWGFILLNGALASLTFAAVRHSQPFVAWNPWVRAVVVGLGYLGLIRLKFSTFEYQGREVPFGFEAAYETAKSAIYRRVNAIAKRAREAETLQLSNSTSLGELARKVRLAIVNDSLLSPTDKLEANHWLLSVLNDAQADETEKRDALATYLLSGSRSSQ